MIILITLNDRASKAQTPPVGGCNTCAPLPIGLPGNQFSSVLGDGSNQSSSPYTLSIGYQNDIDAASPYSFLGGFDNATENSPYAASWGTEVSLDFAQHSVGLGREITFNSGDGYHFGHGQDLTIEDGNAFNYLWGGGLRISSDQTFSYLLGNGDIGSTPLTLSQSQAFAIGFDSEVPQFIARYNPNTGSGPVEEQFQISVGEIDPPDAASIFARGGLITQSTNTNNPMPGTGIWNSLGRSPSALPVNGTRSQWGNFGFLSGVEDPSNGGAAFIGWADERTNKSQRLRIGPIDGNNFLERMTVLYNGNVGIETTAPDRELQVAGDARIDQSLSVGNNGAAPAVSGALEVGSSNSVNSSNGLAQGTNNAVDAENAAAFGLNNVVSSPSNNPTFAFGEAHANSSDYSLVSGSGNNLADGSNNLMYGESNQATDASYSFIGGRDVIFAPAPLKFNCFVQGDDVVLNAPENAFVFGSGASGGGALTVNQPNSFSIGFNTNTPQFVARENTGSGGPALQVSINEENPPAQTALFVADGPIGQGSRNNYGLETSSALWNEIGSDVIGFNYDGNFAELDGVRSQRDEFGLSTGMINITTTHPQLTEAVIAFSDPSSNPDMALRLGLVEEISPGSKEFREYVTIRAQQTNPPNNGGGTRQVTTGTVTNPFVGIGRDNSLGLGSMGMGTNPQKIGGTKLDDIEELSVNGEILANAYFENSDRKWKKNIEPLSKPLEVITGLNGYQYEFRTGEFPEYNFFKGPTYGLLAQELVEVYPHAVRRTNDTGLVVNYNSLSALFVESFKAQQKQLETAEEKDAAQEARIEQLNETIEQQNRLIEAMEARLSALENEAEGDKASEQIRLSNENSEEIARLYPAEPNPFGQETTIRYFLPEGFRQAQIRIFDANGRQIKQVDLEQVGMGSIRIEAGGLQAGSYIYELRVDGRSVDRKKMIRRAQY